MVSVLVGGELVRWHDVSWELIPRTSEDFDKSRRGWRAVLPAETGRAATSCMGARKNPTRVPGNSRTSRDNSPAAGRNGE